MSTDAPCYELLHQLLSGRQKCCPEHKGLSLDVPDRDQFGSMFRGAVRGCALTAFETHGLVQEKFHLPACTTHQPFGSESELQHRFPVALGAVSWVCISWKRSTSGIHNLLSASLRSTSRTCRDPTEFLLPAELAPSSPHAACMGQWYMTVRISPEKLATFQPEISPTASCAPFHDGEASDSSRSFTKRIQLPCPGNHWTIMPLCHHGSSGNCDSAYGGRAQQPMFASEQSTGTVKAVRKVRWRRLLLGAQAAFLLIDSATAEPCAEGAVK